MTAAGAEWIHRFRKSPTPQGFVSDALTLNPHKGPPWVVIDSDAIPFVREGRNVFHGFIKAVDSWLRPGTYCHVVDESGELIAHGISTATIRGMNELKKGIAVKIRDGIKQ